MTIKLKNMLYSITPDVQKKESADRYMRAGIHENSELVSIEFKRSEKGSEFLVFNFKNAYDETLAHTEWKTMPSKNFNTMSDKEKDLYLRLVRSQLVRINAIATTFITEEQFQNVKGNTFEEFANSVINVLGDSYKGKKIRIKVVYDKRNFTALPSSTRYTWIEPMTISKEESRIKILPRDKMQRDLPNNVEGASEKENEIFEVMMSDAKELQENPTANSEDELPF